MNPKVDTLVADTSAFINNSALQVSISCIQHFANKVIERGKHEGMCDLLFQELGNQITTVQEVVNEITNKRQIRRLVVLPYDLQVKDVFQENIQYSEYLILLMTYQLISVITGCGYPDLYGSVPPVHYS
jgi:hypothetical protein